MENSRSDVSILKESLEKNSKFYYYKGMTCEFKDCRSTTAEKIYDLNLKGKVTKKDAFILQAVAMLSHATCQMVLQLLTVQAKKYPEKSIPATANYNNMLHTLKSLAKNGLLSCKDYVTTEKNVILIYSCTYQGYLFFKNQLESTISFDSNALFRAEHETFKRLAANSVALALANGKDALSLNINGRSIFGTQTKPEGYVYAGVSYQEDLREHIFLVEPVYFSIDTSITTEEEEIRKVEERFDKLEKIYEFYQSENIGVTYVFCVENIYGLKNFLSMAKTRSSELYEQAIFTTENVLYQFNYNLNKSFICINFEKKKINPLGEKWFR